MKQSTLFPTSPYIIWLLGVAFVLFQFFLQLSSGVVISALMEEMPMTALTASLLSSAFYYVYTSLQIPAGVFFDSANPRNILSISALICSTGCLIFAESASISMLFLGRLVIGMGSAFAFVGLSHLLRQHFPLRQFGFLIGLSETLGFIATMLGVMGLGIFIHHLGWRAFLKIASGFGYLIALLLWCYIPGTASESKKTAPEANFFNTIMQIIKSGQQWINGCFAGLGFTIITVFAAMWAIPFIQVKLQCNLAVASLIDAMIFLGAAIGCPLFGYLGAICEKRKPLMYFSCFFTAFLLFIALYYPISNAQSLGVLFFAIGLSCGSYMLAYSITNELSPPNALSTSTGFTNTLAMLAAPIVQLLIGYLLDRGAAGNNGYRIEDFQLALFIMPFCLITAGFLAYFLPEKTKIKLVVV